VTFSSPLYLTGHAAYMGEMKYRQQILVPKWDGTDLEDLLDAVWSDNSIKMDIKETVFWGCRLDLFCFGKGPITGHSEQWTVSSTAGYTKFSISW